MERFYAPIDNKNLMEDGLEDDVFQNFYAAKDHRTGTRRRHLIGSVKTKNYDAIVDVKWLFADHTIDIQVLAVQPTECFDVVEKEIFDHYEQVFKAWQCEENYGLVVMTKRVLGILTVSFFFEA